MCSLGTSERSSLECESVQSYDIWYCQQSFHLIQFCATARYLAVLTVFLPNPVSSPCSSVLPLSRRSDFLDTGIRDRFVSACPGCRCARRSRRARRATGRVHLHGFCLFDSPECVSIRRWRCSVPARARIRGPTRIPRFIFTDHARLHSLHRQPLPDWPGNTALPQWREVVKQNDQSRRMWCRADMILCNSTR